MSNCINSGISKIYILTQFNSTSLNRCIATGASTAWALQTSDNTCCRALFLAQHCSREWPVSAWYHVQPSGAMLAAVADPCILHRHLARTYNFGSGVRFGGDGFVEVLAATQTPTGEHLHLPEIVRCPAQRTAGQTCTLGLLLCCQLHILPSAVDWRCLLTAVHFALPATCCAMRRRPAVQTRSGSRAQPMLSGSTTGCSRTSRTGQSRTSSSYQEITCKPSHQLLSVFNPCTAASLWLTFAGGVLLWCAAPAHQHRDSWGANTSHQHLASGAYKVGQELSHPLWCRFLHCSIWAT